MVKKKDRQILGLGLGLSFVSIILWWSYQHNWNSVSQWDLVTTEFIALFGWLFFLGIGLIYFKQDTLSTGQNVVFGSMIGFGFSAVVQYMYSNNIWFDTVITGNNLVWEIQLIIVIIWVIIGIIKGA